MGFLRFLRISKGSFGLLRDASLGIPISGGKRGPNPRFPRPVPEFSGTGRGWGHGMKKHWGFFGDGVRLRIGVFWGFIPENPQDIFGEILGTGIS